MTMINPNQGYGYYSPPQEQYVQQPALMRPNGQVQCYFVQNINEAYNWQVAPGNFLVFKDQDNIHIYTKSLATPYDKVMFDVYTKEQPANNTQTTENKESELDDLREEISKMKDAMRKLNDRISDNKKVGGK